MKSTIFLFSVRVVMDRERGERMLLESQLQEHAWEIGKFKARYSTKKLFIFRL